MPGITIEWLNQKIGALYVENQLYAEEIQNLRVKVAELESKAKENPTLQPDTKEGDN